MTRNKKARPPAEKCKSCLAVISPVNMARHINTLRCKYRGRNRALDKTNLIEVSNRHPLGMLAAIGAIPGAKITADTFKAYIPEQYATAYKTFDKNKGFADLTIEEFFDKLGLITKIEPHKDIKSANHNQPKETLWY
jgi:hypothetical protein